MMMLVYPQNIEDKIGFTEIKSLLSHQCISPQGKGHVEAIVFNTDLKLIEEHLIQTLELKKIIQEKSLSIRQVDDIHQLLQYVSKDGYVLSLEEFQKVIQTLNVFHSCIQYFTNPEECPYLHRLSLSVQLQPQLLKDLNKVFDEYGVKDTASEELLKIRKLKIEEEKKLRIRLEKHLRTLQKEDFTPSDSSLTVRSGRMVIPVKASHKRKIKGFIHDESASGQTVFIEPADVLELNNQIRSLENEEKREVYRILVRCTNWIKNERSALLNINDWIGQIDFIHAKARLALKMKGQCPKLKKETIINWKEACHPLLWMSYQDQGKQVVPLNIELNNEQRILVVSGPNAGGKSVVLKTVALIQYMFQCGLLLPLDENSELGIFEKIFIDIGDEQSLENDLSTYSSHLKNMSFMVQHAHDRSLFLMDELGAGTEPESGGAIAEAILEDLNAKRAFGVVNTHYGNLKVFADQTKGMLNGAMLFDTKNLQPKYVLKVGHAGSSFAFEIANKMGLHKTIIEEARNKLGKDKVAYDTLLYDLETEKEKLLRNNQSLKDRLLHYEKTNDELQSLQDDLNTNRKKIINAAKMQAQRIIQEANQKIEQTIREIKENQAEKESTKLIRKELNDHLEKIKVKQEVKKTTGSQTNKKEVLKGAIKEGDYVRIKEQDEIGKVVKIKKNRVDIIFGQLVMQLSLDQLEKTSPPSNKSGKHSSHHHKFISQTIASFSPRLDVRGKRSEEVHGIVQKFIDNAILMGLNEVKVIHGRGDGILRALIRKILDAYTQIEKYTDEHTDQGGDGVTLVYFK